MLLHLFRLAALIALILVAMFRPFWPGSYDRLAVPLSFMAQIFGFVGLLLVPVGVVWLVAELLRGRRSSQKGRGFRLALVALIVFALVGLALSGTALATAGLTFGLIALCVLLFTLWRLVQRLRRLRQTENPGFNPAPLFLILLPLTALLARQAFLEQAVTASRHQVMANSAELIRDIEAYRAANGRYPPSLAGLWNDYRANVIGVEQLLYEPSGQSYNIFFEQFTHDIAAREIVVYNPLDKQTFTSHNSWILLVSPAELENRRGFFSVSAAGQPHWKYFWFD